MNYNRNVVRRPVNNKLQLASGLFLAGLLGAMPYLDRVVETYFHPMYLNLFYRSICIAGPLLMVSCPGQLGLTSRNLRMSLLLGTIAGSVFLLFHVAVSRGVTPSFSSFDRRAAAFFLLVNGLELPSEEILFRGFVQTRMMKTMSGWKSNLATSALFMSVHVLTWPGEPFVWAGSFVMSLVLGFIMISTGNIWGAIVAHNLNDIGFLFLAGKGGAFGLGGG